MPDWYFVQGIHRSGTTILGTWLQETGIFRTLTLGDILDIADDPALTPEFAIAFEGGKNDLQTLKRIVGQTTRQFDRIRVTREMFEEYCHLTMNQPPFSRGLNLLSLRQPWKQFHPRRVFRLGPDNIERLRALSRILARNDPRPQLYKSPFDVSNPFLCGLPAKHIFVFREPADILMSMLMQVRENYRRRNPYVAAVSRFYRESYRSLWYRTACLLGSTRAGVHVLANRIVTDLMGQLDLMESLGEGRYLCVDYDYMCRDEDLAHDEPHPHRDHVLERILTSFGLDPGGVRNVHSRTRKRGNHRLPAVEAARPRLEKRLKRYRDKMLEVRDELEKEFRGQASTP